MTTRLQSCDEERRLVALIKTLRPSQIYRVNQALMPHERDSMEDMIRRVNRDSGLPPYAGYVGTGEDKPRC